MIKLLALAPILYQILIIIHNVFITEIDMSEESEISRRSLKKTLTCCGKCMSCMSLRSAKNIVFLFNISALMMFFGCMPLSSAIYANRENFRYDFDFRLRMNAGGVDKNHFVIWWGPYIDIIYMVVLGLLNRHLMKYYKEIMSDR